MIRRPTIVRAIGKEYEKAAAPAAARMIRISWVA